MNNISEIHNRVSDELAKADSCQKVEKLRIEYLGKQGIITLQVKEIGKLEENLRKSYGAELNKLKQDLTFKIEQTKENLIQQELSVKLKKEQIDVTLPPRPFQSGKIHIISQVIEELISIFGSMGFALAEGPDIEDEFHNFTALNIPESHPARQMHDSFYLKGSDNLEKKLLRTHTSNVQIRTMKQASPPFRIISTGRTYRCDSDMTHTPMFHQMELLLIDKNIHMGHLKGCITEFLQKFFEIENLPITFRPSFFPFTEPSAEVDIGCIRTKGEIKIGEGNSSLEILGCGMVHPNVLRNVDIDPTIYQGFALGAGIERLAMLKYGASDLRMFFDNDIRWLNHYGFSAFDIPSLIGGLSR